MPVQVCSRCQRTNPASAVYCYFDGTVLRADAAARAGLLPREFVFPSGRKCKTFDEFAQGCYDEWLSARDLMKQGVFQNFFGGLGRADLGRAAQEAMAQGDPDIGLTGFLQILPVSRAQHPKIDLHPRRILLGTLLAGEQRELEIAILNIGQGILQGTIKVTEGASWLKLQEGRLEVSLSASKEQKVKILVDTRGVPAGQQFGGKLTVVSNGGVVEVPLRMELMARPFDKAPFQGARTPREMAVMMKNQPKPAGPFLESGEIARWFISNGWNYPVKGTPARKVAGVQQFFEAMGLSKPPPIQVVPAEVKVACTYPETSRQQLLLATSAKKWVYASVESNQPWLRVLTPTVAGPQKAPIGIEIDSRQLNGAPREGVLTVVGNSGQTLSVRVVAEVQGAPKARPGRAPLTGILHSMVSTALALLLLRLLLVPVTDGFLYGSAVRSAGEKLGMPAAPGSPAQEFAGWLQLPWNGLLWNADPAISLSFFQPGSSVPVPTGEFRHYFLTYFTRVFVLLTFWLGPVLGGMYLARRGGAGDVVWGIVAGILGGLAVSATAASLFFVFEWVPHLIYGVLAGGKSGGGLWLVWVAVAAISWAGVGLGLSLVGGLLEPVGRFLVQPIRGAAAGLFGLCGMRGLAQFFSRG